MTLVPLGNPAQVPVDDTGVSIDRLGRELLKYGGRVEVPTWQAMDVSDKPQGVTIEIPAISCYFAIPQSVEDLQKITKPNLPWAEEHFKERVSGEPLNPPPSAANWPFTQGKHEAHTESGKFSHTYPERFWPKNAGMPTHFVNAQAEMEETTLLPRPGIRFAYGDLNDVVNLLASQPTTRQAYLPVFFPEDTGAVQGQRIPCTLGYQFLMRNDRLHIIYSIRSCDFLRHFRDDVYMAARLCQWMLGQQQDEPETLTQEAAWGNVRPGNLTMHIGSLHVFEGDLPNMRRKYES